MKIASSVTTLSAKMLIGDSDPLPGISHNYPYPSFNQTDYVNIQETFSDDYEAVCLANFRAQLS